MCAVLEYPSRPPHPPPAPRANEMRPMKNTAVQVTRGNLMENKSLVPAAQEAWNAWEIHFLMLLSLFLQVFLFLFAGMRRRSTSSVLRTVLWLAYLSADSVAIFVLGHLALHASEPRHQLMSFWAPFVLVHLGGQDSITAFSKQDNELWTRHLLTLVTQVVVAGYVVAMASWPDNRLKAAMVLMFLCGCFKYAERVACLYFASPARLGSNIMKTLATKLGALQDSQKPKSKRPGTNRTWLPSLMENSGGDALPPVDPKKNILNMMLKGRDVSSSDIMSVDAPLNEAMAISVLDHLPNMFVEFHKSADRYKPYKSVGARLGYWYRRLYTKGQLREFFYQAFLGIFRTLDFCLHPRSSTPDNSTDGCCPCFDFLLHELIIIIRLIACPFLTLTLILIQLYPLFQTISTPIALVLFRAAEKRGYLQTSQADIIVSYVLLVGAIVLDLSSAIISIFSFMTHHDFSRKQWSKKLAQYSMINWHAVQDTHAAMLAAARLWIRKLLGAWGIEIFDVTHTPISKVDAPIKEFILDNLVHSGTRKEWNIASSRGQLAVQNWMRSHQDPDSASIGNALEKIVTIGSDFPTTVLIWHIATDICYYFGDNPGIDSLQMKKHKQMSRELSNYIMYLVFKCGVMLTTNSKLSHDRAHDEISKILSNQQGQRSLGEKEAVMKLFAAKEENEHQDETTVDTEKLEEPADNNTGDTHVQKLVQSAQATTLPVVPRARLVAKKLISINDETERWDLIAKVWSEMLYYAAPRCGCAFHYEHLSTGGEFITHVLLLMKFLGPFLPPPEA